MNINHSVCKLIKVSFAIAFTLLVQPAFAVGTCEADKSDIAEDMQKITEKLTVKYGSSSLQKPAFTKDDLEAIYDEQELKVDRSNPFLKQVNSVGVVTNGPAEAPISYGTAVLISPCHVLINAHAIVNDSIKNGQAPILISLGQNSCESKDAFTHQDIKGKVIASGNAADRSSDYAIVRIPKVSDIEPALISTEYLNFSDSLMTVGFPYRSTLSQKTGFRYPIANFNRITGIGIDGTFISSNTRSAPGASGSGVFVLDEDNGRPAVIMAGIHRSEGGGGLQTAAILKQLKANNKKVYFELAKAIRTKTCE